MKVNKSIGMALTFAAIMCFPSVSNAEDSALVTHCKETSGKIHTGKILTEYSMDSISDSEDKKVMNIFAKGGGQWQITFSSGYITSQTQSEMRHLAMTAILTGAKVDICSDGKTSPQKVWGMQMLAD
ncbi:hypothetical protein [Citrobacter meridianamericanus]|uniref:Uncharacterized protein n=1 Tax=Citrobacter meridianamericanus TaxID=2894201 RepID=A0ABT1B9D1_9ENTR|nr:hypothetical protein [Citrobacter meridianamericanus]MCO5781609.1 hypothetical protein [Citrobacter meridianamericanus]